MTEISFPRKLDINATDLELAIRQGCHPMQCLYDPQNADLPYFNNTMSGPQPGSSHFANYSIAHLPGRWLNALLNAENALGLKLNEEAVRRLAECTYQAFDHPMGLPQLIDLETYRTVPVSDLHNLRESMHALYALAAFRGEERALGIARTMIATVNRYFDFHTGEWKEAQFAEETGGATTFTCGDTRTFPISFGRFIGPLVKLYKACGEEGALLLAIRLKDYAFRSVLNSDGDYDVSVFGGHTHSTTAMISSLAQLGELLGDHSILERVHAFMDNGMKRIALDFGWCIENDARDDHYGEINNTSDIMETCLILGRAGYEGYLERAERILRAHFLPSQLLDTRFIPDPDCPEEDYRHRLASRSKGAFGFPCPYGHEYEKDGWISFNWDIVGGGVGGLCEAYRSRVEYARSMISINLHFDYEDDNIRVASPYTNDDRMEIRVKGEARLLRVRLSEWMAREKLTIKLNDGKEAAKSVLSGEWLLLSGLKAGDCVQIGFPMTERTVSYGFRKDVFTFRWRGDAVIAAGSGGRRLCFFDEIEA